MHITSAREKHLNLVIQHVIISIYLILFQKYFEVGAPKLLCQMDKHCELVCVATCVKVSRWIIMTSVCLAWHV